MLFGVFRKIRQTAACDKIYPIRSPEIKILAETDKGSVTNRFTLATKGAPAKID